MQYHLNINGEVSGPHSQFAVIDRIRDGALPEHALVWRQGFDKWLPAKQVEEFTDYWPQPESADDAQSTGNADSNQKSVVEKAYAPPEETSSSVIPSFDEEELRPRPWLRFMARMLDYMAYIGALTFFIVLLFPSGTLEKMMSASTRFMPVESLFILGYVPLEAWLLSRFGKTPGRALLRLEVYLEHTGQRLNYRQALIRSLQVYVKGVGLWLPLVNLFAMSWSRIQLLRTGRASWDENCGTVVVGRPLQRWRFVTLAGILLMLTMILIIGQAVRPEMLEALRQASQGG